jgi:sarcosine oxidase/N-methyl-L-tryptophan oxidase
MQNEYDLIIVGTGSVGAAAGYYAAKRGLKVLEIDAGVPPHADGSHHGMTRIIRHAYGEGASYVPMVLRAQQLWGELDSQVPEQIFHQTGVLNVGPRTSPFLKNVLSSARKYDLPVEKLTADQIRQRWPEMAVPDHFAAAFETDSGYLMSELAIKHYVRLARELGAVQQFNSLVRDVSTLADGRVSVTTNQGEFVGRQVLVSAGTWAKELLPDLPIQPVRKVFAWFDAATDLAEENKFPAFTVELDSGEQYYGFPADGKTIKIGHHQGGQVISNRAGRVPFDQLAADFEDVSPFTDMLAGVGRLDHGASCTYDMSSDGDFIIDWVPNQPAIQVVTGLSGHGFKFASVLGEIVVQRVLGEEVPFDLRSLRLNRFSADEYSPKVEC